jgi:hypothetical protein
VTLASDLSILYDATPPDEIKQRQGPRKHQGDCPKFGVCPQPHMMLDYVDARYVMDKLDRLGPENWQDQFVDRLDGSVRCGIGIRVGDDWIWKWDVGTVSDIEPEKGAYSEAFKRAGVKWGIARDLYGHKAGQSAPQAPRTAPVPRMVTPVAIASPAQSDPDEPPFPSEMLDVPDGYDGFQTMVRANTAIARPTQNQPIDSIPMCPTHNVEMKPDKRSSHQGEWSCTRKNQDNSWCSERYPR